MRPQPLFENYLRWLQRSPRETQIVKLSYLLNNLSELERCNGLILTGGGDVHPSHYHREDALADVEEVNEKRDEFEFQVIDDTLRLGIPILGICRGVQLFNVAMGGSLVVDLEDAGYECHRQLDSRETSHTVRVEEGTLLHRAVQTREGVVNTMHHQAADRIGHGLTVSARSHDGVIEAMEWEDQSRSQFLMLVQWHPERTENIRSPFSQNIRECFIDEVGHSAKSRSARL